MRHKSQERHCKRNTGRITLINQSEMHRHIKIFTTGNVIFKINLI